MRKPRLLPAHEHRPAYSTGQDVQVRQDTNRNTGTVRRPAQARHCPGCPPISETRGLMRWSPAGGLCVSCIVIFVTCITLASAASQPLDRIIGATHWNLAITCPPSPAFWTALPPSLQWEPRYCILFACTLGSDVRFGRCISVCKPWQSSFSHYVATCALTAAVIAFPINVLSYESLDIDWIDPALALWDQLELSSNSHVLLPRLSHFLMM